MSSPTAESYAGARLPITTRQYLGLAHDFIVRACDADPTGSLLGSILVTSGPEAEEWSPRPVWVNLKLERSAGIVETRSTLASIVETAGTEFMRHSRVFGFGGAPGFLAVDIGPALPAKDVIRRPKVKRGRR